MKPMIGITASMETDRTQYTVPNRNVKAIQEAGGLPVIIPYLLNDQEISQITEQIDGLYATGGYDIDPILFNEEPHPKLGTIIPERDQAELAIMKKMLEKEKPILGVCRGCQILNIAVGGDMYQDIYSQMDKELLQHSQKAPFDYCSHYVEVEEGTLLYRLTGKNKFRINSFHHQANRAVPEGFQISGKASDGVIEAIESRDHPFVLGLQWHPEGMIDKKDDPSLNIYRGFIDACKYRNGA